MNVPPSNGLNSSVLIRQLSLKFFPNFSFFFLTFQCYLWKCQSHGLPYGNSFSLHGILIQIVSKYVICTITKILTNQYQIRYMFYDTKTLHRSIAIQCVICITIWMSISRAIIQVHSTIHGTIYLDCITSYLCLHLLCSQFLENVCSYVCHN